MNDFGDILHGSRDALLAELEEAGWRPTHGNEGHCYRHDDAHASAGVYEGEDGVWRFKCHSCGFLGSQWDVRADSTGRPLKDILAEVGTPRTRQKRKQQTKPAKVYASLNALKQTIALPIRGEYCYTNPDTGNVDMVVFRCQRGDGKTFFQGHQRKDGWVLKAPPKPWPILRRKAVRKMDSVVIVEGEKCVKLLHDHKITATTSPGGAGKAKHADWRPLNGKRVYLWPDNDADDKGREHMRDVHELLMQLPDPPRCYWIEPGDLGLPPKGDCEQFVKDIPNDLRRRALVDVINSAACMAASADVAERFERMIRGEIRAIPFPWKELSRLTKALYPGTITLVCGDGGEGKSFFMLQCLIHWHLQGVPAAIYALEESEVWHLLRVTAQLEGNSNLLDDDWIRENPGDVRDATMRHAEMQDAIGQRMHTVKTGSVSLPALARWTEERAVAGVRVIVIDPVTAAVVEGNQWTADLDFILQIKETARKHQCSVIIVTHPKKGRGKVGGLDDVAGGAAYVRLSQTILWIQKHRPRKSFTVRTPCGTTEIEVNRTVRICKARNGRGGGMEIAFDFEGESVTYQERGAIVAEHK